LYAQVRVFAILSEYYTLLCIAPSLNSRGQFPKFSGFYFPIAVLRCDCHHQRSHQTSKFAAYSPQHVLCNLQPVVTPHETSPDSV